MILDFLLNCDSMSLSTKCQLIQILTEGFTGNCTNHSEQVKQVVYGARGGHGGSVVCFGQQRRGHGAGLGADRQQLVTGGNNPKAKHVPSHISIQKKFLLFSSARILKPS